MMKRLKWIAFFLLFFSVFAAMPGQSAAETLSVQVKKCAARSGPSFLGKIVTRFSYADRLTLMESKKPWLRVINQKNGLSGWVHESAVTEKKLVLKAGTSGADLSTTGDEIALAGKGFNKQVENQFQSENPDVDFTWINRMEQIRIDERKSRGFLKKGRVVSGGES